MSNSDSSLLEENQSKIDAQIAGHFKEIQNLKTRRNDQTPVSKMPTELLSKVFLHLTEIWPTKYPNLDDSIQLEWATVSHVCRHWRDVALGYPQLWTDINLCSPAYAQKLLERSKHRSISVTVPPNIDDERRDILFGILPQIDRFRYLRVSLENSVPTRNHIIDILINTAVQQLESLTLEGGPSSLPAMKSISRLLWKGAPRLHHLELTTWYIPWNAPILTALTSLKLTNWISRAGPGTWGDFFDALDRMPDLEELILHTRLPEAYGGNFEGGRTVPLHHLHTFELKGGIRDCEIVLKHLRLHASASVRFIWTDPPTTAASVSDFLTALNLAWFCDPLHTSVPFITHPPFPYLHDFDVTKIEQNTNRVTSTSISARWQHAKSPNSTLSNYLRITLPSSMCPDTIGALVSPFSLTKLQSVKLATCISAPLLDLLQLAPSLKSVHLTTDSVFDFFNFIFRDPSLQSIAPNVNPASDLPSGICHDDIPRLNSPMPFMRITHFSFEGIEFDLNRDMHGVSLEHRGLAAIDGIRFRRFFQLRSRYMHPVYQVDIRRCKQVDDSFVNLLREIIPEVVWDGFVETPKDPEPEAENQNGRFMWRPIFVNRYVIS